MVSRSIEEHTHLSIMLVKSTDSQRRTIGGSQVVTFCSPASKICDPSRIVADSVAADEPLIVVSLNYRLNIFAFGDGKERNLALSDQRLGIDWVRKNIAGFGGNPVRIWGKLVLSD
jgi:hypothetical protein